MVLKQSQTPYKRKTDVFERSFNMIYSHEVEMMCPVAQGANHGPAPIPEEAKWVKAKEIKDISGLTHGIGWCAPQQGACKLTLNVKDGIIQEALVETIGCSGMTHSAAMARQSASARGIEPEQRSERPISPPCGRFAAAQRVRQPPCPTA